MSTTDVEYHGLLRELVVVGVSLTVEAGPETLLTSQVEDAEVLVLGRHQVVLPGTHLGPVARAMLDHAGCPVVLVKVPRS